MLGGGGRGGSFYIKSIQHIPLCAVSGREVASGSHYSTVHDPHMTLDQLQSTAPQPTGISYYKVDFEEGGKSECLEKNPQSQVEINQ